MSNIFVNIKTTNDNSWGDIITKYTIYLLSFFLAFGPINPFSIKEEELDDVTSPFLIISTGLFVISFLIFQNSLLINDDKIRKYATPLLILFFAISLGDITYDINTAHYNFIFKFGVNIVAFSCLYVYFSHNPRQIEISLKIFAISCVAIIMMLYLHVIDNFTDIHNGRLWLFGENPNNTSSRMSMALLIIYYYGRENRSFFMRLFSYVLCGIIFYYIIQSGSRGSFISTIIGLSIFMIFKRDEREAKILQIIVLVVGSILLYPIIEENDEIAMFDRMEELSEGNSREEHIKNAIEIGSDYLIAGCGHNGYVQEKINRGMDWHDSHNVLASVFAMSGLIGLSALIYFFLKLCKISYKSFQQYPISLILLFSMIFIAMKTGGVLTYMLMWYIYAISLAITEHKYT